MAICHKHIVIGHDVYEYSSPPNRSVRPVRAVRALDPTILVQGMFVFDFDNFLSFTPDCPDCPDMMRD